MDGFIHNQQHYRIIDQQATTHTARAQAVEELAARGGQGGDGQREAGVHPGPPDAPEGESSGGQEAADGGSLLPRGALLVSAILAPRLSLCYVHVDFGPTGRARATSRVRVPFRAEGRLYLSTSTCITPGQKNRRRSPPEESVSRRALRYARRKEGITLYDLLRALPQSAAQTQSAFASLSCLPPPMHLFSIYVVRST